MAKYHSGNASAGEYHSGNASAAGGDAAAAAAAHQQQQLQQAGKIRAAHLLVKHRESRRPMSWREAEITRSKEEARQIIQGYEQQIQRGDITLGELALTESDCSSARKRGDLGYFGKGDMQKEFEESAFSLQPGETSGIVETASGLHLIQRCVQLNSLQKISTEDEVTIVIPAY